MSKAIQIENMKNTIDSMLLEYDLPEGVRNRYKFCNDIYRIKKVCGGNDEDDEDDMFISRLKDILKEIGDFISSNCELLDEDVEEEEYTREFDIYNNDFEVSGNIKMNFGKDERMRNLFSRIINHYCRDASRFPTGNRRIDGKTEGVIFTKPPQASKTKAMICAALLRIAQKNNVIIVVDNYNEHLSQIKTSINELCEELHLGERRYNYHVPSMNIIEARDNLSDIRRAFRRGGSIFCCMNNIKQLKKLSGVESRHPYIIIHDESDAGLKMDDRDFCGRDIEIRKLFEYADYVLKVTATPSGHFLSEGDLIMRGSVINGFVPDDYIGMGHEKVQIFSIADNKEHTITKKLKYDFSVPDSPVDKAMKHFLALPQRDTNEPKVLVINMSDRVSAQRFMALQLQMLYPDCYSFVNNGTRMEFYFPYTTESLKDWPFDDYQKEGFVHSWKSGLYYSDMKSYILDLYRAYGVVENPMFEIAGKKADRSLRLKTSEHTWLPTAILFGSSSNMDFASAYQVFGRIFGLRTVKNRNGEIVYRDNETKWAYVSDPIINTLTEGKAITEAYIKSETGLEETMSSVLKEVKITKKQSKVRLSKAATISQQRKKTTVEMVNSVASIRVILPERFSGEVNHKVFEASITAVLECVGTGVWDRRGDVVNKILETENGLNSRALIEATLKDFGKKEKMHVKTDDETTAGFLIRKVEGSNEWELRVN